MLLYALCFNYSVSDIFSKKIQNTISPNRKLQYFRQLTNNTMAGANSTGYNKMQLSEKYDYALSFKVPVKLVFLKSIKYCFMAQYLKDCYLHLHVKPN